MMSVESYPDSVTRRCSLAQAFSCECYESLKNIYLEHLRTADLYIFFKYFYIFLLWVLQNYVKRGTNRQWVEFNFKTPLVSTISSALAFTRVYRSSHEYRLSQMLFTSPLITCKIFWMFNLLKWNTGDTKTLKKNNFPWVVFTNYRGNHPEILE